MASEVVINANWKFCGKVIDNGPIGVIEFDIGKREEEPMAHRKNETERVFPEGRQYTVTVQETKWSTHGTITIPVWATNPEEALSVALGIYQTDGWLFEEGR